MCILITYTYFPISQETVGPSVHKIGDYDVMFQRLRLDRPNWSANGRSLPIYSIARISICFMVKMLRTNFCTITAALPSKSSFKVFARYSLGVCEFYFIFFISCRELYWMDACSLSQNCKVLKGYVKTLENRNAGKNNSFENLFINADY